MSTPRQRRAFTVIELLVAVSIIALLATLVFGAFSGNSKSLALESAQATLGNLVVAARTKAMANGRAARLLIHNDTANPERVRRYLILQEQDANAAWVTTSDVLLPKGVYVMPSQNHLLTGLLEGDVLWKKIDGSTVLHSSALSGATVTVQVNSATTETWEVLSYNYRGTSGTSGFVVLASGQLRTPGTYGAGESPVRLVSPDAVRGLSISSYGMPTYLNGRAAF